MKAFHLLQLKENQWKHRNARGFISDTSNTNDVQTDEKAQFSRWSETNTGQSIRSSFDGDGDYSAHLQFLRLWTRRDNVQSDLSI